MTLKFITHLCMVLPVTFSVSIKVIHPHFIASQLLQAGWAGQDVEKIIIADTAILVYSRAISLGQTIAFPYQIVPFSTN